MTFFHDLWGSVDRLSGAITLANWGIAASLLCGFLFTAFVIIAGNRKDELNDIVAKAQGLRIAEAQRGAAEANATAKQFESRIAESDARVKTAEAAIASANAASKDAVAKVADAQRASAEASTKAEGFRLDIAKANESARQAEARAAEANLELARFKAPRSLSPAQQARIALRLRPLGPRRIDVIVIGDAQEIAGITTLINAALQQAGWVVNLIGKAISGPNVSGVLIGTHVNSDLGVIAAADGLISALQSEGIVAGRFTPQFNDDLPMAIMGNWDNKKVAPIRMLVSAKP